MIDRLVLVVMAVCLWATMSQAAERRDVLVLGKGADRRVALVLGNSAYENAPPLANAATDAQAMTKLLGQLGFEVVSGINLTKVQTQETIAHFAKVVRGADIALFFYAGHGMQVSGVNYLVPVNASLTDETALDFETVPIDFILRQMARDTGVRLVFLDACRDNPLAEILAKSGATAASSGLAEMEIENDGAGTLVAFATSPAEVAYDGKGQHSPFAAALLAHLGEPNTPLTTVMTKVTGDVYKATSGLQRPWINVSLTDEVMLNRVAVAETPPPVVAMSEPKPDGASTSRTAGAGADNPSLDENGRIALNLLRQQIPKLGTEGPITFETPINFGQTDIDGKSLRQLIEGKPLYSPVEGLDKTVWDNHCSACHQWTQARLCEQSMTYVRVDVSIMRLQHPYGNRFKVALEKWAQNGCK